MIKATVNLGIIKQNAIAIKRLVGDKKLCAVVKSEAYGHGAVAVSNALYNVVDYFAVSNVKEGVALRVAGIDKPILVLMPTVNDVKRGVFYRLELSVCSYQELLRINAEAARQSAVAFIQFKLNTGMNRFGFDSIKEYETALKFASKSKNIVVTGVFSHFSDAENIPMSRKQFLAFSEPCQLTRKYFPDAIRHIAASGGALLSGVYSLDMVRIGLLLYGYAPFKTDKINVTPAMKITSPILLRRKLKDGECFLYGEHRTDNDKTVSLIDCGYADGVPYLFKSGENHSCMNVSGVSGALYGEAVLLGGEKTADVIAKEYGTIPYEVLLQLTRNAEYVYE